VEISRRQMLGGGLGLIGAGLLSGCGSSSGAAFSLLQRVEGRAVTSGRTISVRYRQRTRPGSLLVAVVSRRSTRTLAPTIGQVSDDQGNHWRQAVEYFSENHYGVDVWYCESAGGANTPTVSGTGLGYPVLPGITSMNMLLLEYWGASGFELCDQICQAKVAHGGAAATSNFPLSADHELAISAVMGDMESATAPPGWNTRLADNGQGWFVADSLDSGSTSAGSRLTASWSGMTGGHEGVAVLATFVRRGRSASGRRLVQSSYTDSAILPAGAGHSLWRSQPYPVDPRPGNTLIAFMNGSIYNPAIDCGSVLSVQDTAGSTWRNAAESGPDDHTGINISCWICDSALGGPTALDVTFSNQSQQLACLLLEFENLPRNLRVAGVGRRTFGGDLPRVSTPAPLPAGGLALAFRTSIFVLPQGPGAPQWHQIMSDTTGANALMTLDTTAGVVTGRWSGANVTNGLDILVIGLSSEGS
jgi:hypothetical protein